MNRIMKHVITASMLLLGGRTFGQVQTKLDSLIGQLNPTETRNEYVPGYKDNKKHYPAIHFKYNKKDSGPVIFADINEIFIGSYPVGKDSANARINAGAVYNRIGDNEWKGREVILKETLDEKGNSTFYAPVVTTDIKSEPDNNIRLAVNRQIMQNGHYIETADIRMQRAWREREKNGSPWEFLKLLPAQKGRGKAELESVNAYNQPTGSVITIQYFKKNKNNVVKVNPKQIKSLTYTPKGQETSYHFEGGTQKELDEFAKNFDHRVFALKRKSEKTKKTKGSDIFYSQK